MGVVETKFGAAELLWGASNPRNLGTTAGGGTLFYEALCEDQLAHETGATPHRVFIVGKNVWVEVELLSSTLENLLLPISDGIVRTDPQNPGNKALDFSAHAATALGADRLVIHPLAAQTNQDDLVIWKTVVVPKMKMLYQADRDRTIPVTFRALIDEDDAGHLRLARIGDRLIVPTYW